MNGIKSIRLLIFFVSVLLLSLNSRAQRVHCAKDSMQAMKILAKNHKAGSKAAEHIAPIAESFLGVKYEPLTEKDTDVLELRFDAFDDLTFLNTVVAIARVVTQPGPLRPVDVMQQIENVGYRQGKADGFSTKLVYGADWILNNKSRGIIKELTDDYSNSYKTKSLEKLTKERERYVALSDSAMYERQKMVEMGFRTHKIPHLKRESFGLGDVATELRDGDIIMLLSTDPAFDVFERGIIVKRDDGYHFIHASEKDGQVVEEPEPMTRYLKRNAKKIYGWRWLRLL